MSQHIDGNQLAFEIGCEEIPARFVDPATAALADTAQTLFAELRLTVGKIEVHATPRRLILLAHDVASQQADRTERVRGPAAAIAFDDQGGTTKAAQGFARGQGVDAADLVVVDTEQGPYVFVERVDAGQAAEHILPAALLGMLQQIPFPRTMRWGDGEFAFIRPIRWLLALWNDQVLPLQIDDIKSGRLTRGHRTLAPGPHAVAHAAELLLTLEKAYVQADPACRLATIQAGVTAAAQAHAGTPVADDTFWAEVKNLVEWPTPFTGQFDPDFLALPDDLLVTTMQSHQRYFAVRGEHGRLLPYFVAVRNGDEIGLDTVRAGNEKVLRARLADAKFFYAEDLKQPLADYVPALARVTFLQGLGSLLDKTRRLQRLVPWLSEQLAVSAQDQAAAERAAHLAKADQVTHLVNEWPELQGSMGRVYAQASGEADDVAQALVDQYQPRTGDDALPVTRAGTVLALADRIDTLAGSFLAGMEPTGSQDPFALRRQAFTLLVLAREQAPTLDLTAAFTEAVAAYTDLPVVQAGAERSVHERLHAFCQTRLLGQLRAEGYRPDLIEAVLSAGWQPVGDVWQRAQAGQALLAAPYFDDVYTAYHRAYNMSRATSVNTPDPALLEAVAEQQLYEQLQLVMEASAAHYAAGRYEDFFQTVAALRVPVDRMLDEVLVMADDLALRDNRLALLRKVVDWIGQPLALSALSVKTVGT